MKTIYTLLILLAIGGFTFAQKTSQVAPYPGGSPFPPGKEPKLTHTVRVYWSSGEGIQTWISVKAKGQRPIQLNCMKVSATDETGFRSVQSTISPECDVDLKIGKAASPSFLCVQGHGYVEVRVYGFKKEDFDDPPKASVKYVGYDNKTITIVDILPKSAKKDARSKKEEQPVEPKPTSSKPEPTKKSKPIKKIESTRSSES
ncbi:MAG: hypothetical protein PVH19_00380 [Planctomycetia bacterium]|jgi:hypothetical protein